MNIIAKIRKKGIRHVPTTIHNRMIQFYRSRIANGTSVSDDGIYNRVVRDAVQNDDKFKVFRRNDVYCQIVECPGEEEGKRYIEVLEDIWSGWKQFEPEIARNDAVGGPRIFEYSTPVSVKGAPYTIQKMMEIGCMLDMCPYLKSENWGGALLKSA